MPVEKSAISRTGEPVTMQVERRKIQELARDAKRRYMVLGTGGAIPWSAAAGRDKKKAS
jgi:hypothetical protein